MVLRHSAQTLLAPQEYDLKDFIMPVAEYAEGFAESIQISGTRFHIRWSDRDCPKTFSVFIR